MSDIRNRFREKGRMLPEGVQYRASWVTADGKRCFQVMESPNRELLQQWITQWEDLVDFEIAPVLDSDDFWQRFDESVKP